MTFHIKLNRLHSLQDGWLGARAVSWMFSETKGDWWITAFTAAGKQLFASSRAGYMPNPEMRDFAARVCKYVNKNANYGGAWLAGFLNKDLPQEFYLLWKDQDGDIQIPIEFPFPWSELVEQWQLDDFLFHVDMAHGAWQEHWDNMELSREQREHSLVRGH